MVDIALITAFVLGLCVGSFANVLIYRLPRGQQVVSGRSACPHCRTTIAWYDNVPLLSWIALRGRCRHCGAGIGWRYPVVELAVALIAAATVVRLGPTPAALHAFLLLTLLLIIAIVDARFFVIPHTLTVAGLVAGLALAPWAGPGLARAALGAAVGGGIILGVDGIYRLVRGRAGMGGGDVMLLAMIGAYLGPWGVPATLGLAAAAGLVAALLRSGGRLEGRRRLPFGPFLAVGAVIVLCCGRDLWAWYTGLVLGGPGF